MSDDDLTIRDKVAIVGIGGTAYYRRGGSPVSEIALDLEVWAENGRGITTPASATVFLPVRR